MICTICQKELPERSIISHLTRMHSDVCITEKDRFKIKIDLLIFKYNIDVNKLISQYISGISILELQTIYNLQRVNIVWILKLNNISIRNLSEQGFTDKTRNKTKSTLIDKYGVDNVSKSEIIKNKKKDTFIKNYGVDNIWKYKPYYVALEQYMLEKYGQKRITDGLKISKTRINFSEQKWQNILNKTKTTYINNCISLEEHLSKILTNWRINRTEEQYLDWKLKLSDAHKKLWANMSDEERIIRITKLLNIENSLIEQRIGNILMELKIPYTTQFQYLNKYYDFKINNTKIIIEVNGDYWHANPDKYKSNDILNLGRDNFKTAQEIWNKDKKKINAIESIGYKVIIIWEKFIRKSNDEELKLFILENIF